MVNKGYICVVQNNHKTNYLKLAYALALSIKNTQNEVTKLSIVTDLVDVDPKYQNAFDQIIPLKNDRAKNTNWKLHNIVDLYDYSPYSETVILDSDMLFLSDISHWWNVLSKTDMCFTTHTKTFRNEPSPTNTIYRQEFIKNNLPSIYMAFCYFKKSNLAKEVFDFTKLICDNWVYFVDNYLYEQKPRVFSTDVAFALAIKLLGVKDKVILPFLQYPYFIHMKLHNQNWGLGGYAADIDDDWRKCVDVSFDNFNKSLGVKIGTLRQHGILHYHIKDFINEDMIKILEQ